MAKTNLRPMSEISEVRHLILKAYIKALNPPKNFIEEVKAEFNRILLYKPCMMPYCIVQEIEKLGFDINEE